jgi:N-acetylglucosaminyl-diphospho-decaprenol L-rhamnosyltransferase
MAEVAAVVVTYDALPWLERCLDSVRDLPTVVVDNGSSDGTVAFVRERYPGVTLLERENRGLAAGWTAGIAAAGDARYVLLLNADAGATDGAVHRLVAAANADPTAAVVGPLLRNPDGSLQRSVRGFPTLWRLATEYLFLRKLAPRSRLLNAFYAGGFDHDRPLEAEWLMGACLLVRRAAIDEVGPPDDAFFLFCEETDWCYRFRRAGWRVLFEPAAEVVHVLGAAHGGRLYREQVRGHLRYFAKHHGLREAERARRLLRFGAAVRGVAFPRGRRESYRAAARWLASGRVPELLADER